MYNTSWIAARGFAKFAVRFLRKLQALLTHLTFSVISKKSDLIYLTCERGGGGGAHLHGRYSVAAICERYNFTYVNTPVRGADFSDGPEWDSKWNAMLDFESLEISKTLNIEKYYSKTVRELAMLLMWRWVTNSFQEPTLFKLQHGHGLTDYYPDMLDSLRPKFRTLFRGVPTSNGEDIVIHVRRGNDETASVRFESDEVLLQNIDALMKRYPGKGIRIYSNAPLLELAEALPLGVLVDTETNPFAAVTHMADAEVLVIAKSSLSYFAGLISKGQVYFPEFWHPPMNNWKSIGELFRCE